MAIHWKPVRWDTDTWFLEAVVAFDCWYHPPPFCLPSVLCYLLVKQFLSRLEVKWLPWVSLCLVLRKWEKVCGGECSDSNGESRSFHHRRSFCGGLQSFEVQCDARKISLWSLWRGLQFGFRIPQRLETELGNECLANTKCDAGQVFAVYVMIVSWVLLVGPCYYFGSRFGSEIEHL